MDFMFSQCICQRSKYRYLCIYIYMYSQALLSRPGSNNTLIVKILTYKYHLPVGLTGELVDSRTEVGRESRKWAWNILLCQKARKVVKMWWAVSKGPKVSLKKPPQPIYDNMSIRINNNNRLKHTEWKKDAMSPCRYSKWINWNFIG